MIKAVHVHTDPKFVSLTEYFDKSVFDNTVVVLGNSSLCVGEYSDRALLVPVSKRGLQTAVCVCSEAELVILYNLNRWKSYIAASLPQDIIVAWRFFGYELYERVSQAYLSKSSLELYRNSAKSMTQRFKKIWCQAKFFLLTGSWINESFFSAIKRADLFLGLSQYEYAHLGTSWKSLPPFIQWPWPTTTSIAVNGRNKGSAVIIGNNRSVFNNHLDVLDLVDRSTCDSELAFVLPFSYGREDCYTNEVRRRVFSSARKIRLLEDFLPPQAYFGLITEARAAVFNCYRQMAMGNIFMLLAHGVKIYLHSRNAIYHWLIALGFRVYTIEHFATDLAKAADLELSPEEKMTNAALIQRLQCEFSKRTLANAIAAEIERKAHAVPRHSVEQQALTVEEARR